MTVLATRTKVVPRNIGELLTAIGLASWFMDDGGKTGSGIHLNTNGFSKADLVILLKVLTEKFGLKCSIHDPSLLA